jgi:hypothetical protein
VASAKGSFDSQKSGLTQLAANVILLDRILAHYGPEAKDVRAQLRQNVEGMLNQVWPGNREQGSQVQPTAVSESLYERLQELSPKTDSQRTLQNLALNTGVQVAQARWLLFAQKSSSVPPVFLVVLVFWLAVLFASFSMFAEPNATVVAALVLAALSVAGAIFLILELDRPFDGFIQISSDPLQRALSQLGR